MTDVTARAIELESKIKRRLPGRVNPDPPATVDQIRTAELLHGAPLTPELIALAELHNGCGGWPGFQGHLPLAQTPKEMALWPNTFPRSGGPFEERKSVIFAAKAGLEYLVSPLDGDYRGHVFRMSIDGYHSCYAASSIAELFESWIYLLDHGYLSPNPGGYELVPTGSEYHVEDGLDAFTVLLEAWPEANPLSMELHPDLDDPAGLAFIEARQEQYGIDPRLDPRHPDHIQWCDETIESLERQEASMLVEFRSARK